MARDMIGEAHLASVDEKTATRNRWIAKLRREGHRQCYYTPIYVDGDITHVCAMGLLAEVVGDQTYDFYKVGSAAELNKRQVDLIVALNDGRNSKTHFRQHAFAEIADVIEGWFK